MTSDLHATERRLEKLFHTHSRELVSFFVRRGFPTEDARDLVQECFVRLYKILSGKDLKEPRAYLYQMARGVAANSLRDRRTIRRGRDTVVRSLTDLTDGGWEVPDPVPLQVEQILEDEKTHAVRDAINALPEVDRQIVGLWLDGRSYSEISIGLALPLEAVRSRLYRVRQLLERRVRSRFDRPDEEGTA